MRRCLKAESPFVPLLEQFPLTLFQSRNTLIKNPMRLAFCLEYPISLHGGVSVLVEILIRETSRLGHEIVLVSADTPATIRQSSIASCIQQHFETPKHISAASAAQLARQLKAAKIQLAHFHAGGNYGWGNRFPFQSPIYHLAQSGVPCISSVHLVVNVLDGFCGPEKPRWFKLTMLPLAWLGRIHQLKHTEFEIAVSQHDFQKLARWYAPYREKFVQIYHSRLHDEPPATVENREPVILNVGHIAGRKGQEILAAAFAQLAPRYPEWSLELAGHDGGDGTFQKIEQLAKSSGLQNRIRLLGERNDALALMRRAAIYVQPSFAEALGLALQEAMFCGCPSVGSRAGGIPELIEDNKTGFLVEPGNVSQLVGALEKFIANPQQRNFFGHAAAASIRAKGMTVEIMIQRHIELYERVAKEI